MLHAAIPNPFNPQTRIRFEVSRPSDVRLEVFAADGRLVRRLVAGQQTAGTHEVVWDGRDGRGRAVASGVYLARLVAGGVASTERLVLLR
jgi:flagellar hook assembly protein FlgD